VEVSGPGLIATQSASVFCQIRKLIGMLFVLLSPLPAPPVGGIFSSANRDL